MANDNDRSIAAVLKDIVGNLQQIVRAEIRLAKVEVREEVAKAKRGAIFLVIGGLIAAMALGFVLLSAVYGLATVVQPWLAALIVGAAAAAIGGLLVSAGAKQFTQVNLAPPKTIATVQENIQWAKSQAK